MREFLMVLLILSGLGVAFFLMPRETSIALLTESGPVENAQALLYVIGAVVSWAFAARGIWKNGLLGGMILAVFALRELDIQTTFTSMSVMKTRFFISPEVPVEAKLIECRILRTGRRVHPHQRGSLPTAAAPGHRSDRGAAREGRAIGVTRDGAGAASQTSLNRFSADNRRRSCVSAFFVTFRESRVSSFSWVAGKQRSVVSYK